MSRSASTTTAFPILPAHVRIVEVGPRDGLQNESVIVPTDAKVRYIRLLVQAGFQDIEITSFVSPMRVPQLADATEVCTALSVGEGEKGYPQGYPHEMGTKMGTGRVGDPTPYTLHPTPRFSALVPNQKGLDRALEAGIRAIAVFTAASETFTQKNIGMSIAESLETFRALIPTAKAAGCWVRAYVSTAFYCPYEGYIAPKKVLPVIDSLAEMGIDEISVGDTIGHAVPTDVARLLGLIAIPHESPNDLTTKRPSTTTSTSTIRRHSPTHPLTHSPTHPALALHFHDTRGTALANVLTALQYGVSVFDSSAGGVGGCPFAPGAAGNLATEDLLYMLNGMGIQTGVDLEKVVAASRYLSSLLGRPLPGKYLQSCS